MYVSKSVCVERERERVRVCVCVCTFNLKCHQAQYPLSTLFCMQVTLGVFLVVPPFEVWVTWCVLGCAWILTFLVHEVVFIIYKICKRVKND